MIFRLFLHRAMDALKSFPVDEPVVVEAATIICLRKSPLNGQHWEVLLGQNMVKNWLRSKEDDDVMMRYPGEWKFPGGVFEESDETLKHTAIRELLEEFDGLQVPESSISTLVLLNTKVTLPIKGKRYHMHNYVAFEENNPWMTDDSIVDYINENLESKQVMFTRFLSDGKYWKLATKEKEKISPEVNKVEWMSLDCAIEKMASSMESPVQFVDDWQKDEFSRYGILSRDPMFQTMTVLQEIRELNSVERIREQSLRLADETKAAH